MAGRSIIISTITFEKMLLARRLLITAAAGAAGAGFRLPLLYIVSRTGVIFVFGMLPGAAYESVTAASHYPLLRLLALTPIYHYLLFEMSRLLMPGS